MMDKWIMTNEIKQHVRYSTDVHASYRKILFDV